MTPTILAPSGKLPDPIAVTEDPLPLTRRSKFHAQADLAESHIFQDRGDTLPLSLRATLFVRRSTSPTFRGLPESLRASCGSSEFLAIGTSLATLPISCVESRQTTSPRPLSHLSRQVRVRAVRGMHASGLFWAQVTVLPVPRR